MAFELIELGVESGKPVVPIGEQTLLSLEFSVARCNSVILAQKSVELLFVRFGLQRAQQMSAEQQRSRHDRDEAENLP